MYDEITNPTAVLTPSDQTPLLVLMTAPDRESAQSIARTLVRENLAACCSVLPAVESIYRWDGKMEESTEVLVIIKSIGARFEELRARISDLHPYEIPEVVAMPITRCNDDYLKWIFESTNGRGRRGRG